MTRQGITWYNLETETETVQLKYTFHISDKDIACLLQPECNFLQFLQVQTPSGSSGC